MRIRVSAITNLQSEILMSRAVHRFALLVAIATFFLIIAGANVTSHDAGLATSDWPLSNGQVFPRMVGNLFWEHGHRLVATTVGLLTIALAIVLQIRERRSWVKRLGWVALGGVIAQGLLGGLTVKMNLPLAVSAAHATLAQLFFLTTVSLAVFTSRSWMLEPAGRLAEKRTASLRRFCLIACAAIFVQLILGAVLRHSATWDQFLPTGLLAAHIAGALVVALTVGTSVVVTLRNYLSEKYLSRPAILVGILLLVQLALGVITYFARAASPNDPQPLNPMISLTVAHVAGGALVFAATILLTLRAYRVLRIDERAYVLAPA